jgi:molybdate transport system substrate-binding protein
MALALGLAACGLAGEPTASAPSVHVFAASSLQDVVADVSREFAVSHPGVKVRTSFAGSQILRIQIESGAGADIYLSADTAHMARLDSLGLVLEPRVFAYNELVVIVPLDDPAGVASFDRLVAAERIVIGTPEVPVGRYTREMLARAALAGIGGAAGAGLPFDQAVMAHVVSQEPNVRQVRAKVELGEADAAIVYVTDALASDRVRTIPVPDEVNVRAAYVAAVTRRSVHRAEAEAWVASLFSDERREALRRRGFVLE